jgi:class 3 adenylate cyclase
METFTEGPSTWRLGSLLAQAGQVVVSEETAQRSGDRQVWFDPLGAVELKGVAKPLPLYQAYRRS